MNQNRFWLQDGSRDKDFIPFQNWPDSLTSKVNRNEKKENSWGKKAMKILRSFQRKLPGAAVWSDLQLPVQALSSAHRRPALEVDHHGGVEAGVNQVSLKRRLQSPSSLCPQHVPDKASVDARATSFPAQPCLLLVSLGSAAKTCLSGAGVHQSPLVSKLPFSQYLLSTC